MMTVSQIAPKAPQLTLNFEPQLADDYPNLRAFIAFRVQQQKKPAKSIAGDMDMAPSTLSRKLNAGQKDIPSAQEDTQRFNCDDLENYIAVTGDTTPIEYLASKYLHSDTHRLARLMAKAEAQKEELDRTLNQIRAAA